MDEGALGCGLGDWQGSVIGKIQRLARGCEAAFASFYNIFALSFRYKIPPFTDNSTIIAKWRYDSLMGCIRRLNYQ